MGSAPTDEVVASEVTVPATPDDTEDRTFFPVHRHRRFIVTGAARGIGAATAETLVSEGARVVVADVRYDEAKALADRLGDNAAAVRMDVGAVDSLQEGVDESVAWLRGLDGIVSNAAIAVMRPALEHDRADWQTQFDINVHGAFEVVRASLRYLEQTGGRVVFVSSESGKRGHTEMVAYNATRAALINITRVLAEEWAPHGVNVNCVCPGGVATQMLVDVAEYYAAQSGTDAGSIYEQMAVPQLGRLIEPLEVAAVISFLLSSSATAVRGQSINVDGGQAPY